MRILLRQPAAGLDPYDQEVELVIAASPDTHARRPWEWDVRLTQRPEGLSRAFEGAGLGRHHVDVRARPDLISAELRTLDIDAPQTLAREEPELWVLVVESGTLRQGAFALVAGDVLVCEGDDPLDLDVAPSGGTPASFAMVVLRRVDGRALRWVP